MEPCQTGSDDKIRVSIKSFQGPRLHRNARQIGAKYALSPSFGGHLTRYPFILQVIWPAKHKSYASSESHAEIVKICHRWPLRPCVNKGLHTLSRRLHSISTPSRSISDPSRSVVAPPYHWAPIPLAHPSPLFPLLMVRASQFDRPVCHLPVC